MGSPFVASALAGLLVAALALAEGLAVALAPVRSRL